jgi:intein/homing endonuclease
MDDKDLEIARLQEQIQQIEKVSDERFEKIQELERKLSEVSDAIYDVYRSI